MEMYAYCVKDNIHQELVGQQRTEVPSIGIFTMLIGWTYNRFILWSLAKEESIEFNQYKQMENRGEPSQINYP